MATAFTESEKEYLKQKLVAAAEECLMQYGIKKTTIDELVKRVGISKGAFYLFYPAKESLFFEVFEKLQKDITGEMMGYLDGDKAILREQFAEVLYRVYQKAMGSCLVKLMLGGEMEYLMRKLPPEVVAQHQQFDDGFAEILFARVKFKAEFSPGLVSAAFRAVFLCALHKREVGEAYFNEAMKLMINGLANQMVEE